MQTLIDTSVWIDLFKDKSGRKKQQLTLLTDNHEIVLSRFTQLELLQGAKNEREWQLLETYLEHQPYLEVTTSTWHKAARMYFNLRRRGKTVRSPIDCCLAQIAIEAKALLLHRDQDFITISTMTELRQEFVEW